MTKKTTYKGFEQGLNLVKFGDYKAVVAELYSVLGINNRTSFAAYKRGAIEPKVSQVAAIESVFAKYGVSKQQIWG